MPTGDLPRVVHEGYRSSRGDFPGSRAQTRTRLHCCNTKWRPMPQLDQTRKSVAATAGSAFPSGTDIIGQTGHV
jgi:hypothetical protein